MNHLWTKIIIPAVEHNQFRHLSLTATKNARKNKNNCKEETPKYILERSCLPCCFYTWKPKIPILKPLPPLVAGTEKTFKKKPCYAGMKIVNQAIEGKKKAEICQKMCCTKDPVCIKPELPKPEVKVDCSAPIPTPDWDINVDPLKEICESMNQRDPDPPPAVCRKKTKH